MFCKLQKDLYLCNVNKMYYHIYTYVGLIINRPFGGINFYYMKTIKTFSFVSPDSRYSICEKKFNFLIQELEGHCFPFRYSMNVIFACNAETGESVKILQCKIILEKGMITKILSNLL